MEDKEINKFPHIYSLADFSLNVESISKHAFPDDTPSGITIHHAADRSLGNVLRALEVNGLGYHVVIERDGRTSQLAKFDRCVWHAGKAIWNGQSPNARFLAVSLLTWGEVRAEYGGVYGVSQFKAWNGSVLPNEEIVCRVSNNGTDQKYWWDAATNAQVASLTRFCLWAVDHGISIDNICGHDECAIPKGRKSDPGGVLPMTMLDYRDQLAIEHLKTRCVV